MDRLTKKFEQTKKAITSFEQALNQMENGKTK